MSRARIFRGQNPISKEWVEGNLIEVDKDDKRKPFTAILEKSHSGRYTYPSLNAEFGTLNGHAIPVRPETVSEYSEVDDINGNKIWEGNECKIINSVHSYSMGYIAKVHGCFVFISYKTQSVLKLCDLSNIGYSIEVTGDWYDEKRINKNKGVE